MRAITELKVTGGELSSTPSLCQVLTFVYLGGQSKALPSPLVETAVA